MFQDCSGSGSVLSDFGANTLAFTMTGDNHVAALLTLRYPVIMRSLSHNCEKRKM